MQWHEAGVPRGLSWHSPPDGLWCGAVVAPEGLGPCCVRSQNAGVPTSPTYTSQLVLFSVPDHPQVQGQLWGLQDRVWHWWESIWLPQGPESLACCCLGQPRTGGMKNFFVSLDQAPSPSLLLGQLLEAKTGRDWQMVFWRVLGATGLPQTWQQLVLRGLQHLKLGQIMGLPSCTAEGWQRKASLLLVARLSQAREMVTLALQSSCQRSPMRLLLWEQMQEVLCLRWWQKPLVRRNTDELFRSLGNLLNGEFTRTQQVFSQSTRVWVYCNSANITDSGRRWGNLEMSCWRDWSGTLYWLCKKSHFKNVDHCPRDSCNKFILSHLKYFFFCKRMLLSYLDKCFKSLFSSK